MLLLASTAAATEVRFSLLVNGAASTNKFSATPTEETALQRSGTNVIVVSPVYGRFTASTNTVTLQPADYDVVIASLNKTFRISVPNTNVVCDVATLSTTLATYTYTNNLSTLTTNVITGTNVLHFVNGVLQSVSSL